MSAIEEYIQKLEEWDHKLFLNVYESKFSKRTQQLAKVISFFGSLYFWGLVWIIWFIYGYITKNYYLLVLFTGAFDQSIIIHLLIKYKFIRRNRPFITLKSKGVKRHDDYIRIPYLMSSSEAYSFPSGHVAFFLLFGCVFATYYNNFWILFTFIIFDVLIAISRIILGVHFPIDVIFGFLFGLVYAFLYLGLTCRYWVNFYYYIGPIISDIIHFWR